MIVAIMVESSLPSLKAKASSDYVAGVDSFGKCLKFLES